MKIKHCVICNNNFSTNNTKRETCSKSCASKLAYKNQYIYLNCSICNEKTKSSKSVKNAKLPVYCKKCTKKRYTTECKYCSKIFRAKRKCIMFCSNQCKTLFLRKDTKEIICDFCGIVYQQAKFNIYKNKKHYCSKKCSNNSYSKSNPSRYGGTWTKWIRLIKQRDKLCLLCNSDKNLQVHHFKKLKEFSIPDNAHYHENLGLFCVSCHKKVEGKHSSLSDFLKDTVRT